MIDFGTTPEEEKFFKELDEFLEKEVPPEVRRGVRNQQGESLMGEYLLSGDPTPPGALAWFQKLGEKGYLGMNWPPEYGGKRPTTVQQWQFMERLIYKGLPVGGMEIWAFAPVLLRWGTEEQKQKYLPGIMKQEVHFAMGHTEPSGGTDLAALQTRAVRDGDEYVINGQKMFTTTAHFATHVWLAVRTNPELPKHKGISILLVPMDTPGITVRPLMTQTGEQTNEVFFEDVRVPVSCRVGEEGQGFLITMTAIDFERAMLISDLRWMLDQLIEYAKTTQVNGRPLSQDSAIRQTLARLACDIEMAGLLGLWTSWTIDQGESQHVQVAMHKLWAGELRERLANAASNIVGPLSLTSVGGRGVFEGMVGKFYLRYPLLKFGAGGIELLRARIAQRGLDLPRDR
ncbi:MAG: acyl-CoA dehydrogenase family protein [Chloroflexi bacterium]|nr:acyl-CoA dehydrogenase family protein [Chloroflexota bacterium]